MDSKQVRDEKTLAKVKGMFEAAAGSTTYLTWYDEAFEAFSFVEGRQWTDEEFEQVKTDYKVRPVTINKIAPRLNNVSGMEAQTRTKVVFRARSNDEKEQETSEALSDLAYFVQDKNDSQYLIGECAKDSRICGLGFHEFDFQSGAIIESRLNPLHVVWDITDSTHDFSQQNFVGVVKWITREEAKFRFKKHADVFDIMQNTLSNFKPATQSKYFSMSQAGGYYNKKLDKIAIVEMMYRERADYWVVQTKSDKLITTFKQKEAEKLAKKGTTPEKLNGYIVRLAYFTDNVLLADHEYKYQMNPAKGLFPITPISAFRESTEGLPYGLVRAAIDPQRMYNSTQTRLNWFMSANQVIADSNALDFGNNPNSSKAGIRAEVNRPDGVLLKRQGSELKIDRHEAKVQQHLVRLSQLDKDIQDALGIYDESLGIQTNANSGIAIQKRQLGAARNQAVLFDRIRSAKMVWAKKLLSLIQHEFNKQMTFYITDDAGKTKAVSLNEPVYNENNKPETDADGNTVTKVDIRTGAYDVYLEEVPDNATQLEEGREKVLNLIQALGGIQGITVGLLDLIGVPKSHPFREEIAQGVANQQAQDQAQIDAQAKGIDGGAQALTQGVPVSARGNIGQ